MSKTKQTGAGNQVRVTLTSLQVRNATQLLYAARPCLSVTSTTTEHYLYGIQFNIWTLASTVQRRYGGQTVIGCLSLCAAL